MKLFKRIYYPVLAALLILSIALGFADATYGGGGSKTFDSAWDTVYKHIETIAAASHNSHNADALEDARDYISSELRKQGFSFRDGDTNEDGEYNVTFRTSGGKFQPSFTVQESTLTPETVSKIDSLADGTYVISKTVHNVVAVIPGTDTLSGTPGKAVMLMAHYDSRPEGSGASDNTVAVAAMLGVMENVMSGIGTGASPYKNDLVFVLTDAEEEHMYGAYAFKYQFKGFNDVYSRVELGANFDNLGNKGTLVMFQTSDKNDRLIARYSKINGGAFTSSIADFVYGVMTNFTDFEIYDDKTSLDFANVGGTDVYHTYLDSVENVNKGSVEQQYSMMQRYVEEFGGADLAELKGSDDSVYYSYLDMGVASYPKAFAYALGVVILLLAAAGIAVSVIKRRKDPKAGFSVAKMGSGVAVQLLTMIATLAVGFAAYFLICLLLVGFGVVPFRAILSLRYASVPLIISVMLLTLAILFGFYNLFKKLFAVRSADVARGTAYLWGVIAAVLSFAMPTLSYFFALTALGELCVVLALTLFKEKYREKTGEAMDKLFLYLVPLVFTLPMIIPIIMIASTVLGAVYLPVIMMLFMLVCGFIAPYFTQLQPVLDGAAGKLPPRMVRVERTVTKMVEDRAKKGKFTEQTVKEVNKEPLPWRYKNYVGVSFLSTLAVVLIIIFSSFNAGYSSAIAGGVGYRNAIYNDSVVYVWEKNGTQTAKRTIEIHDTLAYNYLYTALDGFEWDGEKKAYVKEDTASANNVVTHEPTITKNADGTIYTVTPYNGTRSEVTMQINDAEKITSLTFDDGKDEYTVTNDGESTLYIHLPYGYAETFTITIEGAENLNVEYTEHCPGSENINNLREWNAVRTAFAGTDIENNIRAGLVLKYNVSL